MHLTVDTISTVIVRGQSSLVCLAPFDKPYNDTTVSVSGLYRNNVSVWYHFGDITTFILYMSGCELKKFFIFDIVLKL